MRNFTMPYKCLVMSATLLFVSAAPALAQQYMHPGNSEIGTVGDLDASKVKSRVARTYNLQFGPAAIFAGSEVYDIPSYKPFIFPLPNFGSNHNYTGVSFEEYLEQVARSYNQSIDEYLFGFITQNEYTVDTGYIPNYNEVIQLHQSDFRAGGGYVPLGEPTIPNKPQDLPDEFEPLPNDGTIGPDGKPYEPLPTPGADATSLADDAALATEIAAGSTLNASGTSSLNLDGGVLEVSSASQSSFSAANVAVVPEPASLCLLTLGTATLLGRRRR